MKPGDLVTYMTGEWASARRHIGIVLDVCKDKDGRDKIFVYLPTCRKDQLSWHAADDWHVKHFWTIES